jgi:hypothetical protein
VIASGNDSAAWAVADACDAAPYATKTETTSQHRAVRIDAAVGRKAVILSAVWSQSMGQEAVVSTGCNRLGRGCVAPGVPVQRAYGSRPIRKGASARNPEGRPA